MVSNEPLIDEGPGRIRLDVRSDTQRDGRKDHRTSGRHPADRSRKCAAKPRLCNCHRASPESCEFFASMLSQGCRQRNALIPCPSSLCTLCVQSWCPQASSSCRPRSLGLRPVRMRGGAIRVSAARRKQDDSQRGQYFEVHSKRFMLLTVLGHFCACHASSFDSQRRTEPRKMSHGQPRQWSCRNLNCCDKTICSMAVFNLYPSSFTFLTIESTDTLSNGSIFRPRV
jgi:hypothetical protein